MYCSTRHDIWHDIGSAACRAMVLGGRRNRPAPARSPRRAVPRTGVAPLDQEVAAPRGRIAARGPRVAAPVEAAYPRPGAFQLGGNGAQVPAVAPQISSMRRQHEATARPFPSNPKQQK